MARTDGQNAYLLVVNLHVGHFDLVADGVRVGVGRNPFEEGVAEARDEALLVRRAHHGVGLAGACVRKDGGLLLSQRRDKGVTIAMRVVTFLCPSLFQFPSSH